ncbi:MAG: hypothetical protein DRN15_08730 [Thermoprotei archaeon]|nr:MAG: hypothetical protein DRN15_08730 [Thermoprotei archaeon]
MNAERMVFEMIKSKKIVRRYRRKPVIRDRNVIVSVLIPVDVREVSREELKLEAKGVVFLDVPLIEPTFEKEIKKIEVVTKKEVTVPSIEYTLKLVSVVKYTSKAFQEVKIKDIVKEISQITTLTRELVNHILENIPTLEFSVAENVEMKALEKGIVSHVRPVSELLNYVSKLRITFHTPRTISAKELSREIIAKMSRVVFPSLTKGAYKIPEGLDPLYHTFSSPLSRILNMPLLILAEPPSNFVYEYMEFLKRVLREIYRVRLGGLPNPLEVSIGFDEIKFDIRASKAISIVRIDDIIDKTRRKEREGEELREEIFHTLSDRIKELYSQNLGFLVVYGREVEKLLKVELPKAPRLLRVKIVEDESIFKLCNLMWGLVHEYCKVPIERLKEKGLNLDAYVVELERRFYDELEKLLSDIRLVLSVEPSKRDEERIGGESLLHYATKVFIVKYLLDQEKIPPENIFTEYEIGDLVIDVFVNHPKHGELAIEVETLYGTGIPVLKLRRTIETRLTKGLKLWIVIPNPQLTIFLRDIMQLYELYKRKYPDRLNFFTLDVKSKKLVSLEDFVKCIRELKLS